MRLILLLITALTFIGCSKDDDKTVTVEYTVSGGNADGVMKVRTPQGEEEILESKGANIVHKRNYIKDGSNLIMLFYHTATPVKEGFKMSVKVDGKIYDTYYLSKQFSNYTYEIDLPSKI